MDERMPNFLKELLESDELLGGMREGAMLGGLFESFLKTTPKTAGNIIADAKVAGKKVEVEHLAEAVQHLTAKINEVTEATKAKEGEFRETIKCLMEDLANSEERAGKLGRNLSQAEREVKMATDKNAQCMKMINGAKNILTLSNGETPATDTIDQLKDIFRLAKAAPPSDGTSSLNTELSGASQPATTEKGFPFKGKASGASEPGK
jgi:hypothetical protein